MIAVAQDQRQIQNAVFADLTFNDRRIHAVLQGQTESGSHKDHAGRFIIHDERRRGLLGGRRRTRLLVPSSGNFGHSIATHTADTNSEVVIVTDVLSPKKLVRRFGTDYNHVQVEIVDSPDTTGSHMLGRMQLVRDLLKDDPQMRLIDQYSDARIPLAYELYLLTQIYKQMRGDIAGVFVAVGTGGLANSVFHFRQRFGLRFPIFAVDADGSCLARPPRHGARRRLSGYGNGVRTPLMNQVRDNMDRWVSIQDHEAVNMCHELLAKKGIFVGPSSGAVIAAFAKLSRWRPEVIPQKGNIIAILPDGGEAYQDTVFNREWLNGAGFSASVL